MPDEKKTSASEELAQVELELKKKELKLKDLQLQKAEQESELTQLNLDKHHLEKESRSSTMRGRHETLTKQTETRRDRQARCAHRMGGNGLADIYNGDSDLRSVAKVVLPTGDMFVRCTRCRKEWHAPDPAHFLKKALNRRDYKDEVSYRKALAANVDRDAYQKAFDEYREVCSWRNGGMQIGNFGVQFNFERDGVNINREKTSEMSRGARENAL